jgi:peptidoglycan hydrolase-like protein with peptidoglycan-binding domain
MASCGIPAIDVLFSGSGGAAIATGSPDRSAVGAVQDLLAGHGASGMPGPLQGTYGLFGPATTAAVRQFQLKAGLPQLPAGNAATATVDGATLKSMVTLPAVNPTACRVYLTLVLDYAYTGMLRVMSLTTLFEGGGRFGAQNRNTDRAGLSFGLIQWAQSPRRLNELLRAFSRAEPQAFVRIFGGGNADVAQRLLAHTARPRGGTDHNGRTTDPAFDLVQEPWTTRFRQAAQHPALQRVQVDTAIAAFRTSHAQMRTYAPQLRSERAVAFMLDLTNQHGDAGGRSIFTVAAAPGRTEAQLMQAMEEESVRRVAKQFGAGSAEEKSTRHRRSAFRTSPLLSDAPFDPSAAAAAAPVPA